jgi:hypothetical protein
MNALVLLATLVLPFAGEIGWVNDVTKTCLYRLPNTSKMYFVVLPADQECPKQVEIRTDDPEPTEEARQARNAF